MSRSAFVQGGVVTNIAEGEVTGEGWTTVIPGTVKIGWTFNGVDFAAPVEPFVLVEMQRRFLDTLAGEREKVLANGVRWKFNIASQEYAIPINAANLSFLSATAQLKGKGRTNSHGGFWRPKNPNANDKFSIDDAGLAELAEFVGEWVLAIHRIALVVQEAAEAATDEPTLNAVTLPAMIDWTVTWGGADPGQGWDDNTVTQAP